MLNLCLNIFLDFSETVIEELSSSSLLQPASKKPRHEEDVSSSYSEEEESGEVLLEETLEDLAGPMCCVCQRFALILYKNF